MTRSFDFDDPTFVTCGCEGEPGQRVFFIQASQEGELISFRLEKQQVQAIAQYMSAAIADFTPRSEAVEPADLVTPVVPEWLVGDIGLGIITSAERLVIELQEMVEVEDPDAPAPEGSSARLHLSAAQAAAFAQRADELMVAGRPPCPICGRPMNDEDHVCPRTNGSGPH